MQDHKYHLGQKVNFSGRKRVSAADGEYQIVRLLPAEAGQFTYRIRSALEATERVVSEDQINPRH